MDNERLIIIVTYQCLLSISKNARQHFPGQVAFPQIFHAVFDERIVAESIDVMQVAQFVLRHFPAAVGVTEHDLFYVAVFVERNEGRRIFLIVSSGRRKRG